MLINQTEPDREKPCWTLVQVNEYYGRLKFKLREFVWRGEAWRATGEQHTVRNLRKAWEEADWYGKLPHQGQKRRPFMNADVFKQLQPMFEAGMTIRAIEEVTQIGRETIRKLRKVWQERPLTT